MASPLCATCLTQDRWLKPLQAFVPERFATTWLKYGITPETLVCWECEANILRVARFTAQAIRAQAVLLMHQKNTQKKPLPPLKSMSKLDIRATIHVNTEQLVDLETNLLVNAEPAQNLSNTTPSKPQSFQATANKEMYLRCKRLCQEKVLTISIDPTPIPLQGFPSNSETPAKPVSKLALLPNIQIRKQTNGNNSLLKSQQYKELIIFPDKRDIVAVIPDKYLVNDPPSVMVTPTENNPLNQISGLVQDIKTEYDIVDPIAQQAINATVNGIKIDNIRSLNTDLKCFDNFNIKPVIDHNLKKIGHIKKFTSKYPNNTYRLPEPEPPKPLNVHTLTQVPIAVISNPTPVDTDTLDFEENIPVTKIISEDTQKVSNTQPQVVIEALNIEQLVEKQKKDEIIDLDKVEKPGSLHTYSKTFESYITDTLVKEVEPMPKRHKLQSSKSHDQPNEPTKPPSKYKHYYLKLLDNCQVMEQREINSQRMEYKFKKYKCKTCIKGWTILSSYEHHIEVCHPSAPEYKFYCQICNRRFKDKDTASKHYNDHYNVYACRNCTFAHSDLNEIKNHQCETLRPVCLTKSGLNRAVIPTKTDEEAPKESHVDLVEISDDSGTDTDSSPESADLLQSAQNNLLVPRKKKRKPSSPRSSVPKQTCVHCCRAVLKSDMESHMKRKHPELIRFNRNKMSLEFLLSNR